MKSKLYYWGSRGNGELIRLVLAASGTPYKDECVGVFRLGAPQDAEPFLELRDKDEVLTFDALPLWVEFDDDDKPSLRVVQSRAIVRHLARKCNLYGATLAEQAKVDEIIEQDGDAFMGLFLKAIMSAPRDPESLEKTKQGMKDTDIPKHLGFFERILRKNEGSTYAVGKSLTAADMVIWRAVDEYLSHEVVTQDDLSAKYPNCKALYDHLPSSIPSLAQYINSPQRPLLQSWWIANPMDLAQHNPKGTYETPDEK